MKPQTTYWASAVAWTFACLAAGCGRPDADDRLSSATVPPADVQTLAQARLSSEERPNREPERALATVGGQAGPAAEPGAQDAPSRPVASAEESSGSSEERTGAAGAAPEGDAALAAKVRGALMADSDLKRMGIDVKASDGDVTLSGTVNNQVQIDRAVALTRGVEGVVAIRNAIAIRKS